jgi:hypothetical protein
MRRNRCLVCLGFAATLLFGCIDDSHLAIPPPIANQSFVEEFDTLLSAYARGWRLVNRSEPIGPGDWVQAYSNIYKPYTLINAVDPGSLSGNNYAGNLLPAYSSLSSNTGYISTSCYASAGTTPVGRGTISNWVVSPPLVLQNGDKIIFYTTSMDSVYTYDDLSASAGDPPNFLQKINSVNRLEVRINTHDETINCGKGINPGQFDKVLLDINPTYSKIAYPYYSVHGWTRMEATVGGLEKPVRGRFAFRYFLEGGGPDKLERGGIVNLDRIEYVGTK